LEDNEIIFVAFYEIERKVMTPDAPCRSMTKSIFNRYTLITPTTRASSQIYFFTINPTSLYFFQEERKSARINIKITKKYWIFLARYGTFNSHATMKKGGRIAAFFHLFPTGLT